MSQEPKNESIKKLISFFSYYAKYLLFYTAIIVALLIIIFLPIFISQTNPELGILVKDSPKVIKFILGYFTNWGFLAFIAFIYFREELKQLLKRIKKGGGFEFYQSSDSTSETEKPNRKVNSQSLEFNYMQLIILHTLIHYQKLHHRDDFSKKWGFTINNSLPNADYFFYSMNDLIIRDYVFLSGETNMYHLTQKGYDLCIKEKFTDARLILKFP